MVHAQPGLGLAAVRDERTRDVESQVRRIVASPIFRNSPVLQSFLQFVTDRALHDREAEINEYAIATEVFARSADFDPAADTIVRTQAYRLRLKLQQYYSTAGIDDPVIIEIPKGHYVPRFHLHDPVAKAPVEAPKIAPIAGGSRWWRIALSGVALLIVFGLGWFGGNRTKVSTRAGIAEAAKVTTPVEAFWLSFLQTDRQPIVAFTNGQFLGTETGDLLRFTGGPVADRGTLMPNPDGPPRQGHQRLYYEDDYTGVGEVLAAVAISNALAPLTGPVPFKRSHLVTAYDLQHHNLIFLGSPGVNPILYDLPQPPNFIFRSARTPPLLWHSLFENVHPAAGELPSYQLERDPATGVLRADFATVTLLPGIAPGRKILVLAGLSTSGTEGAAESVTMLHGVTELAAKLGVPNSSDPEKWPEAFQALLRVQLSRGLDVTQSHTVATRVTKWKK